MDWHIPLIVVAIVFGVVMVWRFRPVLSTGRRRETSEELKAARARLDAAKDDATRALALCDIGDATAARVGGRRAAGVYYMRAALADPRSADIIVRVSKALIKRPHTLEALLWRHLGAAAWDGERAPAVKAALAELVELYNGRLRNATRGRALEHALQTFEPPST